MMHRLWVRFRFWLMAWGLLRRGLLLRMEAGDVLVLSTDGEITFDQGVRIQRYLQGRMPDVEVVILDRLHVGGVLRMHSAHGDGHATMPDPRERADDLRRVIKSNYWGGISAWLDRYRPETDE